VKSEVVKIARRSGGWGSGIRETLSSRKHFEPGVFVETHRRELPVAVAFEEDRVGENPIVFGAVDVQPGNDALGLLHRARRCRRPGSRADPHLLRHLDPVTFLQRGKDRAGIGCRGRGHRSGHSWVRGPEPFVSETAPSTQLYPPRHRGRCQLPLVLAGKRASSSEATRTAGTCGCARRRFPSPRPRVAWIGGLALVLAEWKPPNRCANRRTVAGPGSFTDAPRAFRT